MNSKSNRRGTRGWVLPLPFARLALWSILAFCLGALPVSLRAEEPEKGPAQGTLSDEAAGPYGNTPEAVIPYRGFKDPYKRNFEEVIPFRGVGREEKPDTPPEAVRVGFMGPIGKAPDADLGQSMHEGVTLAFEQANQEGGFEGLDFELVVRPDVGRWGATSNEMVAFRYKDDVLAVIGSIDGANTHIALRVALKTETVMINTGDTDPTLTETNLPWIVRVIADDRQQGYALAHRIFVERRLQRVAALRVNNRYGRVGIAEFRDAARRLKRPLRVELRWTPGDRDFSAQLARIADVDAQAVVIWGSAHDAAAVVHAIRQWNNDNPDRPVPNEIYGCDRLATETFVAEAGEDAEGVVAAATLDPTRPDARFTAFREAFRRRFDHEPDAYAAHAYDGANLLVTAVRHAGLNRVLVRDYLFEQKRFEGVTSTIEFDATLNDVGPVFLATVTDGKLVFRPAGASRTARSESASPEARAMREAPPIIRTPNKPGREPTKAVKIGCFLPMNERGKAIVDGIRLALETVSAGSIPHESIELLTLDAKGSWHQSSTKLVDMVMQDEVVAVIGSTERSGTHLIETLAAKLHFTVVALCAADETINQIPLPWVFNVAKHDPGITEPVDRRLTDLVGPDRAADAAMGYDAGMLVAEAVQTGATDRRTLATRLREMDHFEGATGVFRFDNLGNRVDLPVDHPIRDHDRRTSNAAMEHVAARRGD